MAPGTGWPPNRTRPWCSAAGSTTLATAMTRARRLEAIASLVLRRFLDAIDDNRLDRPLLRFQPQPELFFDSGEDRWAARIGRWRRLEPRRRAQRLRCGLAGVRRPSQFDVVVTGQSGLVDDGAAQLVGEHLGQE